MKLYVPEPQKWLDFFDRVSTGKTTLNQSGSGRRPRVISVDQSKPLSLKAVIPSEQTTAQAKSELEREGINPDDVVRAIQSDTGRGKKRKSPQVTEIKSENPKKPRASKPGITEVKTRKGGKGKKKGFLDIFEQ